MPTIPLEREEDLDFSVDWTVELTKLGDTLQAGGVTWDISPEGPTLHHGTNDDYTATVYVDATTCDVGVRYKLKAKGVTNNTPPRKYSGIHTFEII